jgi:hypothetical protein
LPDHPDKTPSFTVNADKGLFFCHGCLRGGDVVRLAALAWGHDRADVAAAELLLAFGHQVPPRPDTWYAKQERQRDARRELERAKLGRVERRIYRWLFAPMIARFEDADERREEARIAMDEAGRIALALVRRSKGAV